MTVTYSGAQNQAADAPFMPTTFASPVAVIYGLGWWVRKYGQILGAKKYEAARKAEQASAIAAGKKNVKDLDSGAKRLQEATMSDLRRLEVNNPKAFKKVSPKIRKQYGKQKGQHLEKTSERYKSTHGIEKKGWGGSKTIQEADRDLTALHKQQKKLDSQALNRDKPSGSKYNPNKGKKTRRPASLLKKPKK